MPPGPSPLLRRAAVVVALGGLAMGCAQTDRPTLSEDRLDGDSGAELTVDADGAPTSSATEGATDGADHDHVDMGDARAEREQIPPAAVLAADWLGPGWEAGGLDVSRLITACGTLSTMDPGRSGVAGPNTPFHDASGQVVVQSIFTAADAVSSGDKLTELKDALDRCDGTTRGAGVISVEPAPATLVDAVAPLGSGRLTARIVQRGDDGSVRYGDLAAVAAGDWVLAVLTIGPAPAADATVAAAVLARTAEALATP